MDGLDIRVWIGTGGQSRGWLDWISGYGSVLEARAEDGWIGYQDMDRYWRLEQRMVRLDIRVWIGTGGQSRGWLDWISGYGSVLETRAQDGQIGYQGMDRYWRLEQRMVRLDIRVWIGTEGQSRGGLDWISGYGSVLEARAEKGQIGYQGMDRY